MSPPDGATGVADLATLAAHVSNPDGGPLDVSVSLRRAAARSSRSSRCPTRSTTRRPFPAIFTAQTQWIVNNKDARNIVFVTHEGDIVEHYNIAIGVGRAPTPA